MVPNPSYFIGQVNKYLPDHCRIFSAIAPGMALPPTSLWSNTGNNLDLTTALFTGFDMYIEYTLQSLCPGH